MDLPFGLNFNIFTTLFNDLWRKTLIKNQREFRITLMK